MIDEKFEVEQYLRGENINKLNIYRTCYLLAKYYMEKGLDNINVRTHIFEWANKHGIYIEFNLNRIIYVAREDKTKLRGDVVAHISEEDIEEIRKRFDSKNTRMLALALLAYGKVCAAANGECTVSMVGMSNWLNIAYPNLVNRHMQELIDFGYVSKVENKRKWKQSKRSQVTKIRFNVPLDNVGEFSVVNNNVAVVFHTHF